MHQSAENIKFIRLVTGEDIITEIKPDENNYTLVKPLKIVYALGEKPGVISIGLVQWIFPDVVASQEMSIKDRDILTMSDPSLDMLKSYRSSIKRLENNLSFEFVDDSKSMGLDDYEETTPEEFDVLEDLIESMKKRDKGSLH